MSEAGKLIVIEGLDGSGKATQTKRLYERLSGRKRLVQKVTFPDYESKSSTLVKMYLDGEIGGIEDVNLYAASSFYAADRYISFQTGWREAYEGGSVILSDRYTTSNIIYQMAKLPREEWDSYMEWLWDFEFNRMALPEPDAVVYLDMQPTTSRRLIEKRYEGDRSKMDIHEQDLAFLASCRESALYAADKLGWRILRCCDGENPLSIEAVEQMVWDRISVLV